MSNIVVAWREESAHFERESQGATFHRRLTDSRTTGKLIKLEQIV